MRREAEDSSGRILGQALDGRPHIVRVVMRRQNLASIGDLVFVKDGPGTAGNRHDMPLLGEHGAERTRPPFFYSFTDSDIILFPQYI
jgi:hypothetical protein